MTPGRARRRRAAFLGLAAAALVGIALGLRFGADGSEPAGPGPARPATVPIAERSPAEPGAAAIERALRRGVGAAAALGGEVEAAAMLDGWPEPLVEASEPIDRSRRMRMWSMSKVVTMIALLRERGWGARLGRATSLEVDEALHGAIVRSENCRQRRVVLELERFAGGTAAAREAIEGVLQDAGAEAWIGSTAETPEPLCLPYLESQEQVTDPLAPALLLGTSTWRVEDAVRLVDALGDSAYGAVLSDRVLDLMRAPKLASREVVEGELTAPLGWGAGSAFAGLDHAYKAGWGGALNGDFLAGQIALVTLPDGRRLSIAAMFHPDAQPARDDPGITAAPQAIELVMDSLREAVLG